MVGIDNVSTVTWYAPCSSEICILRCYLNVNVKFIGVHLRYYRYCTGLFYCLSSSFLCIWVRDKFYKVIIAISTLFFHLFYITSLIIIPIWYYLNYSKWIFSQCGKFMNISVILWMFFIYVCKCFSLFVNVGFIREIFVQSWNVWYIRVYLLLFWQFDTFVNVNMWIFS